MTFEDGTNELMTIPAEIWRRSYKKATKLIIRNKKIISIELDPRHETADTDFSNNFFPSRITKSRIELYKSKSKIKYIGIRHGEKMHETLVTREEMKKSEDLGKYFKIHPDSRDLNYEAFYSKGSNDDLKDEYNSKLINISFSNFYYYFFFWHQADFFLEKLL